jgi:hypothetical protein
MGSLYELTKEFMDAMDNINDLIEDGLEISEHAYTDTLEMLQMPLEEKVENIVKHMKTLEALADAKKLEAKRLSESASVDLKKAERLKNYMADNLKNAGIKDLQAGVFNLKFRKGTEVVQVDETKTPSVDEAPHLYLYQEPKFMGKTDLKKLIKEGQTIPGVSIVRNPDSLVVK